MKISNIKKNPDNPRVIYDHRSEKLLQSILEFPKMLELRPIVVDENDISLGGNQRLEQLKNILSFDRETIEERLNGKPKELVDFWVKIINKQDVPAKWVRRAKELTDAQKKEFIIKDNLPYGEWDWDELTSGEWNSEELGEWGLDIPDWYDPIAERQEEEKKEKEYGKDIETSHKCPECGYEW